MKNNIDRDEAKAVRLELKYCERCGVLWFRERGGGQVYCDRCLPEVRELPAPWKFPHILRLPAESFPEDEGELDVRDIDAMACCTAGGAA
ncbi:MAG: hypothetical protein LAO24_01050 [Acidobacteriia bacterium]|nr:hypothetical protein [Terriglobia bacterium]